MVPPPALTVPSASQGRPSSWCHRRTSPLTSPKMPSWRARLRRTQETSPTPGSRAAATSSTSGTTGTAMLWLWVHGGWKQWDFARSKHGSGHLWVCDEGLLPSLLCPLPPPRPLTATSRHGCASWWTGASCCSEPPRTTPANTPALPATGCGSHLQPQPSSRCCVRALGCPSGPPWGPWHLPSTPLVPTDPAQVTTMLPETHLPKGMRGIIRCPTRANPPLLSVSWTRDGRPLELGKVGLRAPTPQHPSAPLASPSFPSSQFPGWSTRSDGSIVIATGNDDALGVYTCTPYNSYGTAGASRPTRVLLKVRLRSGDVTTAPSCCVLSPSPAPRVALPGPPHLHGASQGGILPGGGQGAGDPLHGPRGPPTHHHLGEGRGAHLGGQRLLSSWDIVSGMGGG